MSEEKKKTTKQPKTLHVDTLHIHANEIVLHQDQADGGGNAGQQQQPQQMQIPRDFWGFPIRPMQAQQQAGEENTGEAAEATETENNEGAQQGQGPQQGPPPGWI